MYVVEIDLKTIINDINYSENIILDIGQIPPQEFALTLIQKTKAPIKRILNNNIRSKKVSETCKRLVNLIITCGNKTHADRPTETIHLSALLNYCCFLFEEFNLSEDVEELLTKTYKNWFEIERNGTI